MANYLNMTITTPETVGQLNQDILFDDTKPHESLQTMINFLLGLEGGLKSGPCTVSIVVTNANPSVAAAGGGSDTSYSIG